MATARRSLLLVVGIVVAITTSCGEDGGDGPAAESATTRDTAAATESTAEPEGVVPTELHGAWVTTLANGETAELQIGGTFYRIKRDASQGGGHLEADGDTLTFSGGPCTGIGEYAWSLTDGSLTLTMANEECGGRSDVLVDQVFIRKDG